MASHNIELITLEGLEGCWICRLRKKRCQVVIMDRNRPCFDCSRFGIRCKGRGLPRPKIDKGRCKLMTEDIKSRIRNSSRGSTSGGLLEIFPREGEEAENMEGFDFNQVSRSLMSPLAAPEEDSAHVHGTYPNHKDANASSSNRSTANFGSAAKLPILGYQAVRHWNLNVPVTGASRPLFSVDAAALACFQGNRSE
ncbi:uncharacterized protein EI90DRAFT_3034080 [Cantharellus anzutake]|uniref:uncharacterized protein n=1 Tax=Cantharellus anzutake TaxID=1750568 RepID=UPI00190688C7|nr:uncharacterized protein EI90DRAFT_3034080 [Cantharellus anzutake]KAF8341478.1 hypothetical protein EI90DRAFT_3034080 [Cantharellus anzutake]